MIKEVSKGHICVELSGKTATLPGEMFFPPNGKLGFALSVGGIKYWDSPYQDEEISEKERDALIEEIRNDFAKGGHTLELE